MVGLMVHQQLSTYIYRNLDGEASGLKRATVIGRYYIARIDELLIPQGTHDVVGTDGHLIEVSAGKQHSPAMILYYAIEELEFVEMRPG